MIVGLTGGIGSGKSTVAEIFQLLGFPVYFADIESKKLANTSPEIKQKLTDRFGEKLYNSNQLNRVLLAQLIFENSENLKYVNSIIHPKIKEHFAAWVKDNGSSKIFIQEAAILFESGFYKQMDKIILVTAPIGVRIERTMKRDHTSRQKVLERIKNQVPDKEKIPLSDYVVYNDEKHSLIQQTLHIINSLI